MKTKTSLTGKDLNSTDHHSGTGPLLLRLSYVVIELDGNPHGEYHNQPPRPVAAFVS